MRKALQRSTWITMLALGGCGPAEEASDGQAVVGHPITIDTSAVYTITGVQSGKCVEVAGGSASPGAALQLATCNGSTRQQFRMEATSGGYYLIKNVNSGQCVDVEGVSTADGARVLQYTCWSGANQQWSFTDTANGAVRLTARHSGKALDVFGASTADGARLVQWPTHGNTNQQFRVARVGSDNSCSSGTAQPGDMTVSLSSLQQKISGFGTSSAWAGNFRDPVRDPDMLWSTTTGAGLTLHRIRIGGGTTSETRIAQAAVGYGVKVWATPWEVDTAFTDRPLCPGNDTCTPPPKLINPQGWANRLVDFVSTMKAAGVPIYAISAENEPDSGGMNRTISFTPTELATWIGSYLGPALAGTGTKVMGPETMNWWSLPSYLSAIQANPAAWNHVSIVASHAYGLGPSRPEPAITAAGKEYWQTEVDTGRAPDDPTGDNIPSALLMAESIHDHLTRGNLNAWHYWWLWAGGTSGLYNTTTNVWTKRLWALGNFSRFVRPGYMRVSTSGTTPSGVRVSAYTNPADGTVVVVAINSNATPAPLSLFVSGSAPCTMTPWVTSATDNLTAKTAVAVSNGRLSASLAAKSVTTFVGKP